MLSAPRARSIGSVSGESTDHAQDPDAPPTGEGAADAAVPGYDVPAPEMVDVPDAESAAADFAVPPPPTFQMPSVPAAPTEQSQADASASDAVPPPSDATWSAERTWKPRLTWSPDGRVDDESPSDGSRVAETDAPARASRTRVQEKIERASRAGRPNPEDPLDRPTTRADAGRVSVAPSPADAGGSYRGWTVVIVSGLAVLFFGAIGLMVFLSISG